jgi:hypothetical protein
MTGGVGYDEGTISLVVEISGDLDECRRVM